MKRILVVDDDAGTRQGVADLLATRGYDACAVGSFEVARDLLRSQAFDLLITDIRLGEYNGLQLLIESPRRVGAIVMTGFADPVLESDARTQGAAFILKPVDPKELMALVESALAASP